MSLRPLLCHVASSPFKHIHSRPAQPSPLLDMSASMTISSLPHDALRSAFTCLTAKELAALASTNKFFASLTEEIVQDILQSIHMTLFPVIFKSLKGMKSNVNMKKLLHRLTTTQIYTLGGAFNSDQVNCYLPRNNQWHVSADLIKERVRSCVSTVRGYVVSLNVSIVDDNVMSLTLS